MWQFLAAVEFALKRAEQFMTHRDQGTARYNSPTLMKHRREEASPCEEEPGSVFNKAVLAFFTHKCSNNAEVTRLD